MSDFKSFVDEPINTLGALNYIKDFLKKEITIQRSKLANEYQKSRFVGYALEIGFEEASIITADTYKLIVGGIPRNSFLIMTPSKKIVEGKCPPHFILLRVLQSAPTPLTRETQQMYFELHKSAMPEIDRFTQSELQWGALKTEILGMFYENLNNKTEVEFSGDINNFVSAHHYEIYAPDENILDIICNGLVKESNQISIGKLSMTECRLTPFEINDKKPDVFNVDVKISTDDIVGARTAMFGKTRLGKSNIVKIICESIIRTSKLRNEELTNEKQIVGQLVFDINGEYANDNEQNKGLATVYPDKTEVYAARPRENSKAAPLKVNFFENPEDGKRIINNLLDSDGKTSNYIEAFKSVEIPSIESIKSLNDNEKLRPIRKVLIYWSILYSAGFDFGSENKLKKIFKNGFDPKFNKTSRKKYLNIKKDEDLPEINSLSDLYNELNKLYNYDTNGTKLKSSSSGKSLLDSEDLSLLKFLFTKSGSGTELLKNYRKYHDINADNCIAEIVGHLDMGKTVILDFGNVDPAISVYFSKEICSALFAHQVEKFSNNNLQSNEYIQIYFEEAHNIFGLDEKETDRIYLRLAKEGAKYHIGMLYSTQSVTTINRDLIAQTENFFILHLSSQHEVDALSKVNVTYSNIRNDILKTRKPGYVRMLTRSNRFVLPVQAKLFGSDI